MLRQPYERNGLKLPITIQKELGLDLSHPKSEQPQTKSHTPLRRKEKRKAERQENRTGRRPNHGSRKAPDLSSSSYRKRRRTTGTFEPKEAVFLPSAQPQTEPLESQTLPKSILKKQHPRPQFPLSSVDEESDFDSMSERSDSPGLVLDRNSKSFKDRLTQDHAEILALEKKLGLKGKNPGKSLDDGLGDLLEGLDESSDEDTPKKRKREADEWLHKKRQKSENTKLDVRKQYTPVAVSEDSVDNNPSLGLPDAFTETSDEPVWDQDPAEGSDPAQEDGFEGFESEPADDIAPQQRMRENPYIAPVAKGSSTTKKYIPPSLRKTSGSEQETLERLRRQLQRHLNKLSEANIISIASDVEKEYQSNPRQDVTTILIDLLLVSFCDRAALQNTFVILHAAFISAIYKTVGTDIGAEMVSRIVDEFDKLYASADKNSGKATINLISLLSHLYTFHVISSTLLFDYIRLFLSELNESNTELLLKLVRDCGPQLRQDDPSSLKEIVLVMHGSVAQVSSGSRPTSVRTKFMIETITDLKNNKLQSGAAGTTAAVVHITRMRKALGSLNNSHMLQASEPLRIGLDDLRNIDKRGKWWLVGASWKKAENTVVTKNGDSDNEYEFLQDKDEPDLIALAQQHRMNTSIRRSIFVSIMSATDYRDAHSRLMKLRLKKAQELEIPRVLLHCSGAEDAYNPYYTLIAKQLCAESKKIRMAFQFTLWGVFRRLGERPEDDDTDVDEDAEEVNLKEIVNLAKMYSHLIAEGTITLCVLRTLDLAWLKPQAKIFVEVLLISLINGSQAKVTGGHDEKPIINIFLHVRETPQMIKGLQYFVKKILSKTDLKGSKREGKTIKWACKVIVDTLSTTAGDDTIRVSEID